VAPRLAIVHTGEGNGWVGKGWSFGFGAVTRDLREGVPQDLMNINQGKYMLNGSPLLWDAGQGRYRTEIENHQHITYGGGAWTVKDPDGTVSVYDQAVTAYDRNNNSIGTREWLVGSVTDPRGNAIYFRYASGNVRYPTKVYWGRPASTGVWHAVRFVSTGPRPDVRISYATGSKVIEDQRLQSLGVYFNTASDGSGGSLVRTYSLSYDNSSITGASRLSRVLETGPAGDVAGQTRVTTFTYTNSSAGLTNQLGFLNGLKDGQTGDSFLQTKWSRHSIEGPYGDSYHLRGEYKGNTMVADIDNDGIPEFIEGQGGWTGTGSGAAKVWTYGSGGSWIYEPSFTVPTAFRRISNIECCGEALETRDLGARFLDLDRDGDQDLLVSYAYNGTAATDRAWINGNPKGTVWTEINGFALPLTHDTNEQLYFSHYRQDSGVRVADVNGDGHPDLIHAYGPEIMIWPPEGYEYARGFVFGGAGPNGNDCFPPTEFPRPPDGTGVYLKNGTAAQWVFNSGYALPAYVSFVGLVPVEPGDWDCPDGTNIRHTDQGPQRQSFPALLDSDLGTQLLDVNGDGLPDIVKATSYLYGQDCVDTIQGGPGCSQFTSLGNGVYINTGRGWAQDPNATWSADIAQIGVYLHTRDRRCTVDCKVPWTLLDINDDGLPEILKSST
jgi:hypothetical protein